MATILVENISKDLKNYILKVQAEIKIKKGTQISQGAAIVQIVREHKILAETKSQNATTA